MTTGNIGTKVPTFQTCAGIGLAIAAIEFHNDFMRYLMLFFIGTLSACSSSQPRPENHSGLGVKIATVKNHSEGVDVKVILVNTTEQTMRLFHHGSIGLWLDSGANVKGSIEETVDVAPGETKSAELQFRFINKPRLYRHAVIEIVPSKIFDSCRAADKDPDVVRGGTEGRDVAAAELQADTCNRALKDPIRIGI